MGKLDGAFVANMVIRARVSLIAGLKYGIERWNGKWNGTVNIVAANFCNWRCSVKLNYLVYL